MLLLHLEGSICSVSSSYLFLMKKAISILIIKIKNKKQLQIHTFHPAYTLLLLIAVSLQLIRKKKAEFVYTR